MKVSWILVVFLLISKLLVGQQVFSLTTNVHYGFVIPHYPTVVNLIQGHSKALELNLNWKTSGVKDWHLAYNFPSVGVDFFVNNLGNDQQLGNHFSTIGYINFPLNKKATHLLKTGFGIGYTTKVWDIQNNPKDLFLSSHFNAAILLQYTYRVIINDMYNLNMGLRITHFSNGSVVLPNNGINNASVFLGFTLDNLKTSFNFTKLPNLEPQKRKKYTYSTFASFGIKQMVIQDSKKYPIFSFTNVLEKRFSTKTSWGFGLDFFYNSALRKYLYVDASGSANFGKTLQIGGLISYTKHLYPWEIKIMMGAYLRDKYKKNGTIYHRFGLRYHINNHLLLGLSLKTHYARADFPELGVGWSF